MKKLLLSLAIVIASVSPARADWNGLNDKQLKTCVDTIFYFDHYKKHTENDIYKNFSTRGFGRDLAIIHAEYTIGVAFANTVASCGNEYNTRIIAREMWKRGDIRTPIISDRLSVR